MARFLLFVISSAVFVVGQQATAAQPPPNADEVAIRKAIDSYVAAFNQGDAEVVASHWSEKGEWITPDGERVSGRNAIHAAMESYFKEGKGAKIEVIEPNVRFLAPTVAVEEGHAHVSRAGEAVSVTTYIAVHVKQEDGWKIDSVRETQVATPASNCEHLESLEWMVGTWIDRDGDSSIETTGAWTKNKNFLTRSFAVHVKDRLSMEGTQVVGWDPANKRIRSWVFDSNGGYGEGIWTRDGDRWIVKSSHVLQDGAKGSSMNIITKIDDNSFRWRSTGRECDGELLPNIDPITIIRK